MSPGWSANRCSGGGRGVLDGQPTGVVVVDGEFWRVSQQV